MAWGSRGMVGLVMAALLAGCTNGAPSGSDGSPLQATEDTGIVLGVVVDQGIHPLLSANITLFTEPTRQMDTGEDGAFGFAGVPPGSYRLEATKPGFVSAATTVDVVAGVDDPPVVNMQLTFNPVLVPYAETLVFEGFMECSFNAHGRYASLCNAGPIVGGMLCADFSVCAGNITNDRIWTFQPLSRLPDHLQAELVWTSTQATGVGLMLWENYGTLEQFQGGGFEGQLNISRGTSPLLLTANRTVMEAAEIGTTNGLVPQVHAGEMPGTESCGIPENPWVPPCGGWGATFEQRFTLYTHLFYNYLPPPEWRFSIDGSVPPPTVLH